MAYATDLPWQREQAQDGERLPDGTVYAGDWYDTNKIVSFDRETGLDIPIADCRSGCDTPFIVAAVNSLPALLAEREALRAAAARYIMAASVAMCELGGDADAVNAMSAELRSALGGKEATGG